MFYCDTLHMVDCYANDIWWVYLRQWANHVMVHKRRNRFHILMLVSNCMHQSIDGILPFGTLAWSAPKLNVNTISKSQKNRKLNKKYNQQNQFSVILRWFDSTYFTCASLFIATGKTATFNNSHLWIFFDIVTDADVCRIASNQIKFSNFQI